MLDKNNKTWYNAVINVLLNVIIFVLLFLIILYFLISPVKISGSSMEETLSDGQIISTTRFKPKSFEKGDIVIVNTPSYGVIIKRIIAVQGDKIAFVREKNSNYVHLCIMKNGKWDVLQEDYIKEQMIYSFSSFSGVTVSSGIDEIKENNVITVSEGEYFIMGDNRNNSADSRIFGVIKQEDIISKMLFTTSPNSFFGLFFKIFYKS